MEKNWKEEVLSLIVLEALRLKGFARVNKHAFQILKEAVLEQLLRLMAAAKRCAELDQRAESTVFDLLGVLQARGCDLAELAAFLQQSRQIVAP